MSDYAPIFGLRAASLCFLIYINIYIYLSISLSLSIYMYIYICVCVHTHLSLSLSIYIYIYIYTYLYIYIYIYIYVFLYSLSYYKSFALRFCISAGSPNQHLKIEGWNSHVHRHRRKSNDVSKRQRGVKNPFAPPPSESDEVQNVMRCNKQNLLRLHLTASSSRGSTIWAFANMPATQT